MTNADNDDNLRKQTAAINLNEKSLAVDGRQEEVQIHDNHSLYEPAVFIDEHRMEKIKQALPAIEELFEKKFDANHFPGLVCGIVVDGELVSTHCYGYTDLEQKVAATSKSLFRIASMTKSLTAMAIVKLRDDGKLRLDDLVHQYIPELKATDLLTSDAPLITIRHLLMQAPGMAEDDPWADRQLALTDAEFLTMLSKGISLSNPPGTTWEYNNIGFTMLGRIITIVSKIPYQKYIKQEILDPLGMTQTFWEYAEAPPNLIAHGYRWECEQYSEESLLHDGAYAAMGGLISSIEDFSKYVSYHLQAWPPRTESENGPLRRSSLREMQHPWNFIRLISYDHRSCPVISAYCYGLIWSKDFDGIVSVNHSGGLPGFGSNWAFLPEHGIGVVSFANCTYADLHRINLTIIDEMVTLADIKPRQLPVSKILAERKQQITNLLLNESWNVDDGQLSLMFSENFFLDQSLELRKRISQQLFNTAGKILKIGELIPKNQLRGRFYIEGESAKIQVVFSLSPENPPLIQEMRLSLVK